MINPNDSIQQQITDLLIDYEIINDKNAQFDEGEVAVDFDTSEFCNEIENMINYQINKNLEKIINPDKIYPTDIFPEINKHELELINNLLIKHLKFPLDRLSAHISREILNGINKELNKLKEKK